MTEESALKLLAASKAIWKQIEDGKLVRNTSGDENPGWAMRQVPLIRDLKAFADAITEAEGK